MKKAFTVDLYVKVRKNSFRISAVSMPGLEKTVTPSQPFTTQRLLVGQFAVAQECLKTALRSMSGTGLFKKSPAVVMHPQEMVEGGLSEVEERIFRELALGAGARKVALWLGNELRPDQAAELLDKA